MNNKKSLTQLFWPIFGETLFYMLAGIIDTMMVATVGDSAVGAIGTANSYIFVFIIMCSIISNGMMAVMTQNIGAGRSGVAYQARNIGLIFNVIFGGAISLFLFFGVDIVLGVMGVSASIHDLCAAYFRIVGGAAIFNALIPIFAGYLRAFGHTRESLISAIIGNLVNLGLNALFLFSFHWGVQGVAAATAISKGVNLLLVMTFGAILVKAKDDPSRTDNKVIIGQIVRIGLPAALESVIYNLAVTMVIKYLNQMDSEGFNVTARSYASQIASFSYCAGSALAQANSIITGWRVGAKEYEAVKKGTRKAAFIGVGIAAGLELSYAILAPFIMRFFTDNPAMVSTVQILLFIDVFLEIGRVTNLVYVQALKVSGDAVFPVIVGTVFMFLCQVVGGYVLGIHLGLLVVGAYIALAADECVRAIFYAGRFKTGKWMSKGLI